MLAKRRRKKSNANHYLYVESNTTMVLSLLMFFEAEKCTCHSARRSDHERLRFCELTREHCYRIIASNGHRYEQKVSYVENIFLLV
jgi:hypothetical protein